MSERLEKEIAGLCRDVKELKKSTTEAIERIEKLEEKFNNPNQSTRTDFKAFLKEYLFVPIIKRKECYKLFLHHANVNKWGALTDRAFYKWMRNQEWVTEDSNRNFRFDFGDKSRDA